MGESLFRYLWGEGLPDGVALLVWTMPNKASIWCWSIEDAEAAVARWHEAKMEVYYGIGLVSDPDAISRRKGIQVNHIRGDASDILYIPGLWADIDFKNVAEAEALQELSQMDRPPTLVIHSGHGLHVYWLFHEPLRIENTGFWESVSRGWQKHVATRLHTKLDAAWDLPRVLRVPGTINYKAQPVPVQFHSVDGPRYSPEEFTEYAVESPTAHAEVGDFEVKDDPYVDMIKFDALRDDPKFSATWEYRRRDLGDDSPSGYDLSLASFALAAGWGEQETVNLLVWWRKRHGLEIKRHDYYRRTLERAGSVTRTGKDVLANKDDALAVISERWGVPVTHFVHYKGDISVYELHVDGQEPVVIGSERDLLSQTSVRSAVLKAAGIVLPKLRNAAWEAQLQSLMQAKEEMLIGVEAVARFWYAEVVTLYLEQYRPVDVHDENYNESILNGEPVIVGEEICITSKRFARWLHRQYGETATPREMAANFPRYGWRPVKVNTAGGKSSRSYWAVKSAPL